MKFSVTARRMFLKCNFSCDVFYMLLYVIEGFLMKKSYPSMGVKEMESMYIASCFCVILFSKLTDYKLS